ncbi:MAG: hypothetical protein HYW33_01485 [Candidatus Blackburnbacteria bacterium]|nr:hypothetical protein [Candidatus Blackburnbacteria bacterium]
MKILILVGGGTKHLQPFVKAGVWLGVEVVAASFSQLEYSSGDCVLRISGEDLKNFDVIYIRLVGERSEDAAIVAQYAVENKIPLVDSIFARGPVAHAPLKKSLETLLLVKAGIPMPCTIFGSLALLLFKAPKEFGYPFIVKGTYGKQGHAVWLVKDKGELEEIKGRLEDLEKEGKRFLAQEFIKITQRERVFVIGGKVMSSVTLPTKWRRYVQSLDISRLARGPLAEQETCKLAVKAAKVLGIDVAGVDVIRDNETGKVYVLEVNSAPRWAKFQKETGIEVEEEILKYLTTLTG